MMEDDGAGSLGGYVVFTHSGPPPLPGKLNPPSSTYPVSHISIKTAGGPPSLSLPHLQHLSSSSSPLQSAHQLEEGGWLSYPHRLGVNCITVKRPDERRCLTGQEHAGEDGLLSLHPLTSLSPDEEKTDTSSSTVTRCTPPPPGTSGCKSSKSDLSSTSACGGIDEIVEKLPKLIKSTKKTLTTYFDSTTSFLASFSLAQVALEIVDIGLEAVEQVITMGGGPEENTIPYYDRQCREVDEQLCYRTPEEQCHTILMEPQKR